MWIGLPLDETGDAHVTVVIRHEDVRQQLMQDALHAFVAPLLPIRAVIKPGIVMKGYNGDVPTMDVAFLEPEKELALKRIYATYYKQKPEFTAYPELSLHLTVDSPQRLAVATRILTEFDGKWIATRATLKEIGDKRVIDQTL